MKVDKETLSDLIHRGRNHQLTSQMSTDAAITSALEELQERREEDEEAIHSLPVGMETPNDPPQTTDPLTEKK